MPFSIRDVARRAGVSVATVSRIMNHSANVSPEKEAAVREAMEYYQYQPNHFGRGLVKQQSDMIGVFLSVYRKDSSVSSLDTIYMLELLKGIEKALADTEYNIVLLNGSGTASAGRPHPGWLLLQQRRIDGLILSGMTAELEQQMQSAQKDGPLPIVYMGRRRGCCSANIYAQYRSYVRDMLLRVYRAGHRKVLLYQSPFHSPVIREIYEELKPEVPGLTVYSQPIFVGDTDSLGHMTQDLRKFIKGLGCTAICGATMEVAGSLLTACVQEGIRVPEQLSLLMVEHREGDGKQFSPALSAYYVPAQEMGFEAAKALLKLISGSHEVSREFVTKYIARDTLAAPRPDSAPPGREEIHEAATL